MLLGFSHIMFYVSDVENTIQWYSDKLGFEKVHSSKFYGSCRHVHLNIQFDFHLTEETDFSRCLPPVPYLSSNNIDVDIQSLRDKGISIQDARSEQDSPKFTSFQDCDGNWLGIIENI